MRINRIPLLVASLALLCTPWASAKERRPATWDDFADTWIGYDGGGRFLRLTLDKNQTGHCVHINTHDNTIETYAVKGVGLQAKKWEITLQMIPQSGDFAEAYELKGHYEWFKLVMTAKGKGWEMGVELQREGDLARYDQMAKQHQPGTSPLAASAERAHDDSPTNGIYHVAEKGDDLYTCALLYGVTVKELKALNGLTNTAVEPGTRIRIPVPGSLGGR